VSPPENRDDPLEREVRFLKGIGPRRAELLGRLGVAVLSDLLLLMPRGYEDRRNATKIGALRAGEKAVVSGRIVGAQLRPTRGKRTGGILEVIVADGTGMLGLIWFNARRGWLDSFPEGSTVTVYGEVRYYGGPQMVAPQCEVGVEAGRSERFWRILPLYPLTEGLSQRLMRGLVRSALESAASRAQDTVPAALRKARDLPTLAEALWHVHFPEDMADVEPARRRLSYEELLVFQAAFAIRRTRLRQASGTAFKVGPNVDRRIRKLFPFPFTKAQDGVIDEMVSDMRGERPMNRLLQGDVGCGKTVVALYAMLAALAESSRGHQVALMAPTEVLAEQHYLTLESVLEKARVRTMLMSSSVSVSERARRLRRIAAGDVDLVVGTHALIQRDVTFRNLVLLVIDEQHRFGVRQRLELRRKGRRPDVLIMTATPIPRTLALACFGDMDISIIDQMPPGRKGCETTLLQPDDWGGAFAQARAELQAGRRVFVVYPLVEDSETLDLTSAKEGFESLRAGEFRDFDCCLLHGQMRPDAKRKAMEGFRTGRHQVMAATTVVEVGIDVPEATVMIVQHAERLGLAQLHQLRGRIGRGGVRGRCFLLARPTTDEARQRLEVLTRTGDGFEIAEADLRIRGPGQFFGTRQSGLPELRCYDFSDTALLREARQDAFALVLADPDLSRPEHAPLREAVRRRYAPKLTLGGIG